jgi:hypothetical protein
MNKKASDWNIDPKHLLDDPHVNPQLRDAVKIALEKAQADGLFPQVGEAYRTPERSHNLFLARQEAIEGGKQPGPAADAWHSAHNYGLGVDIYLYDANGKRIDYDNRALHPDWYKQVKDFANKYMDQFAWGVKNDSDHFMFHPAWGDNPVNGAFLLKEANKLTNNKEDYFSWIHDLWRSAGAENEHSEVEHPTESLDHRPPELNQSFQPPELNQSFQPPELNQNFQPPDLNQSFPSPELNQSFQPPELNQSFQPPELNQSFQPPELNQSFQPPELNQSYQPSELNQSLQPPELNQSYQPSELNQSLQPPELNQSLQPPELNQSYSRSDGSYDGKNTNNKGYDTSDSAVGGYDGGNSKNKGQDASGYEGGSQNQRGSSGAEGGQQNQRDSSGAERGQQSQGGNSGTEGGQQKSSAQSASGPA